jgi:hypothetical protein
VIVGERRGGVERIAACLLPGGLVAGLPGTEVIEGLAVSAAG